MYLAVRVRRLPMSGTKFPASHRKKFCYHSTSLERTMQTGSHEQTINAALGEILHNLGRAWTLRSEHVGRIFAETPFSAIFRSNWSPESPEVRPLFKSAFVRMVSGSVRNWIALN